MGCWQKFRETVTVEPVIFLFYITLSMTVVAWQQTLYLKFCYQEYQNLTLCKDPLWEEVHQALQEKTSIWTIYSNIFTFVPVLVCITFLSGYSDIYGLKLALLLPFVGGVVTSVWTILQTVYLEWDPLLLMISSFFTGCFGYYTAILMACMTYITRDPYVTNVGQRISMVEACIAVASAIGAIIPGPILDGPNGIFNVWVIIASINAFIIVYILFILRSLPTPPDGDDLREGRCVALRTCCSFVTVKSYFKAITRRRNNNKRLHIHLVTISTMLGMAALVGTADVAFIYVTKNLGKTNTVYSLWSGLVGFMYFFGSSVLGYLFTKVYPITEMTFCVVGGAVTALSIGMLQYGQYPFFFWLSPIFRICTSWQALGGRMYVTRNMDRNEQAAGMGYYATIQTVQTILSSVIFNFVYASSASTWPGLCFAIAGFLSVLSVPLLILVSWNDIRQTLVIR